ncbi:MAG: hypothetical protein MJ131_08685 [Lachnospiraceae bacterium]|nr:hypothetical protein [Lachnospiraceae bacterium]
MTKNTKSVLWLLLCILLVAGAAVAGYYFSQKIAHNITAEAENGLLGTGSVAQNDGLLGTGAVAQNDVDSEGINSEGGLDTHSVTPVDTASDTGSSYPKKLSLLNLVFATNPGTGKIEHIILEGLDCVQPLLSFIYIDPDISYTMSSGLFRKLANKNALLPQTVTFSELYRYYENDKAYEAGQSILGEMLGLEIDYYTALTLADFMSVFRIEATNTDDGKKTNRAVLNITRKQAFESSKNADSSADYMNTKLKNALSSWTYEQRTAYIPLLDSLEASQLQYLSAPVKRNNESTELDCSAVAAMIYKSLYAEEENTERAGLSE